MMSRYVTAIGFGLLAVPALAQPPGFGSPYTSPGPIFGNRPLFTLSPYLNMMRLGNPGVNYYNGVRPGFFLAGQNTTMAPHLRGPMPGQPGLSGPASSGQLDPGEGYVIPPAGIVTSYGNFFGTAGSSMPGFSPNRGGAIAPGIANTRPTPKPARKK